MTQTRAPLQAHTGRSRQVREAIALHCIYWSSCRQGNDYNDENCHKTNCGRQVRYINQLVGFIRVTCGVLRTDALQQQQQQKQQRRRRRWLTENVWHDCIPHTTCRCQKVAGSRKKTNKIGRFIRIEPFGIKHDFRSQIRDSVHTAISSPPMHSDNSGW